MSRDYLLTQDLTTINTYQDLFTRYSFNKLLPCDLKLSANSAPGNDNLSASGYLLTDSERWYMYLAPEENCQINVIIPKPESGKISAMWFNIFSGKFHGEGTSDVILLEHQKCLVYLIR